MTDIGKLVTAFLQLRGKKKQLEEKHKEELRPIKEMMDRLKAEFLRLCAEQGVQSFNTPAGTAYRHKVTSVKVVDQKAFLDHVKVHAAWDLLDIRANKTETVAVFEATGEELPGTEVRIEYDIGVQVARKASNSQKHKEKVNVEHNVI